MLLAALSLLTNSPFGRYVVAGRGLSTCHRVSKEPLLCINALKYFLQLSNFVTKGDGGAVGVTGVPAALKWLLDHD